MKIFAFAVMFVLSFAPGIKDYFKLFPHKPENISIDKEDEHNRITIDEKNGYLMVSSDDADYSFEYGGEIEFTYFVKEDKQKIFGYSEFSEGPSSVSTTTKFYNYGNGKWTEVSVLPDLSLSDFSTSDTVEKIGTEFQIRYQLPQHGTDVTAVVYPVGENNAPFDYEAYSKFINELPKLTLGFDKKSGTFKLIK
jgi:hypothetical protein